MAASRRSVSPGPRLPRDQRRRHDVAAHALAGEVPIPPLPARASLVDEHESRGLALKLPEPLVDFALSGGDRAQGPVLGGAVLGA